MPKKQKLIYLASPFSHKYKHVEKFRASEITRIASKLTKKFGLAMFLPITQSYAMKKWAPELGGCFESWRDIDLYIVGNKADEVWVVKMEGWDKSVGVIKEIEHAQENNVPVKFINPKTLRFVKGPSNNKNNKKGTYNDLQNKGISSSVLSYSLSR